MLVVAILTVRRSELATFRRYEHAAARIMRRYGGAIERALVLEDTGETFRELHVVRFPDDAAFARYREDPELAALGPLREASVVSTEAWPAEDGPRYGAESESERESG